MRMKLYIGYVHRRAQPAHRSYRNPVASESYFKFDLDLLENPQIWIKLIDREREPRGGRLDRYPADRLQIHERLGGARRQARTHEHQARSRKHH